MKASEIKLRFSVSEVIRKYIELRPDGKEFWGVCPFHGERTGSLQVQDERRSWHCYGCGLHGDVIDFVQKYEKCSLREACAIITNDDGFTRREPMQNLPPIIDIYATLESIETYESDLPIAYNWISVWNPKATDDFPNGRFTKYKPVLVHPYRAPGGALYGCTIRVNLPDKKIVPMLRMIQKDGERIWCHFPFEKPRPPYGAETVKPNDPAPILIVEGEKCADIARRLLNGTVIAWAGGTNAVKFTDWSILNDRNVLLWPDNDPEGLGAMMGKTGADGKFEPGVYQHAEKVGARKIKCLRLDPKKPKGWDIGDAIGQDRMTKAEITAWMRVQLQEEQEELKHG